jgi:hypothetical protein
MYIFKYLHSYIKNAGPSERAVCGCSPAEIEGSNPTWSTDICCECCVLPGKSLCDELITRPEKSYRLWCVVVCDLEISRMRPALGRSAIGGKKIRKNENSLFRSLMYRQQGVRMICLCIRH